MKRKKKTKKCRYCEENKKSGNKYCLECGRQINKEFDALQYNYYCETCSKNNCAEHGDVFDREVYCPKCGKKTKELFTPIKLRCK